MAQPVAQRNDTATESAVHRMLKAKKLSQNTLIGEVKFLLPGEKARLRGMFSTVV